MVKERVHHIGGVRVKKLGGEISMENIEKVTRVDLTYRTPKISAGTQISVLKF
jgi:hypothetical protein